MKATIYNFKSAEHFEGFVNICKSIANNDSTFKFLVNPTAPSLDIIADDVNVLHKRCLWLVHKADNEKSLVYKVIK